MLICSFWKIFSILYFTANITEGASLRCYKQSITDYKEEPLEHASDLVNKSYIKMNQELDIVIHGYSSEIDEDIENIIESLMKVFDDTKNYCALNWSKEASAYIGNIKKPIKKLLGFGFAGLDYFLVSIIASGVGHSLGKTLTKMAKLGLKMEDVYLIGHSEGAHLAGAAGRETKQSGNVIGRITALDAAKPAIEKHLDKSCAKLVDALHTDTRVYGTSLAIVHIDFFLNDGCTVQPGCPKTTIFTIFNLCSHKRSTSIMADAIKHPDSFQGRKASSYKNFLKTNTVPEKADINFIGFNIIPSNTGSFYLSTNANPPYGKASKGMDPENCTC